MATAAKRNPEKERQMLVDALRKALDGKAHVLRGTGGLFRGGKTTEAPAMEAVENDYFVKADPPPGQRETKAKQFYRITNKGREFILGEDDPKQALEALKPAVVSMGESVTAIAEKVQGLTRQLSDILENIAGIRKFIAAVATDEPSGLEEEKPTDCSSDSSNKDHPASPAPDFKQALKQAYDTLSFYVEYQDGVVELPHLYSEMKKSMPDLDVDAFKREVNQLWDQQVVELKILNEVAQAIEPEKGIEANDYLYYYLMWN